MTESTPPVRRKSRVLFLAYYFPPLGGASVQPNVAQARNLVRLGHDVTIVAGPSSTSLAWAPLDTSLLDEVPETRIVRLAGPEPSWSTGWTGRRERLLRRRSRFQRWLYEGTIDAGRRLAGTFDVLVAQMAPWETGEAAEAIAAEAGVPWIPALHDPWALSDWEAYPTWAHRRLESRRMRSLLGSAAAIAVSVPECGRAIEQAFPELAGKRVVPVPNGFSTDVFEGIESAPRVDGKFRIAHTGYLHVSLTGEYERFRLVRRVLGGSVAGFNPSTRSHVYLFAALDRLLTKRPELADVIEVHLAGVLTDAHLQVPRSELIHAHGYLEHQESVKLLMSADLLFLPMHNFSGARRTREAPGKIYEYLASGKPVLAAVPQGDARDMLERAGTGLVCRPDDVDAMAKIVDSEVERWASGSEPPAVDRDFVRRYDRRTIAQALSTLIDDVVDESRAF